MYNDKNIFGRAELLLGDENMNKIFQAKVILFGVGGVGSWCAEGLVRSGISHLTIVDSDTVCETNINRQLMATTQTIGQPKVEVLKQRLSEINPDAEITAIQQFYDAETSESFHLDDYDFIVDAIDSINSKVHLIQTATKTQATFISSMGAALKMDSTKIRVDEFWKVKVCPLAASLRRRLKKGEMPAKKFYCVYSEEVSESLKSNHSEVDNTIQKRVNGSLVHITAIFGFTISGLILKKITEQA